MSCADCDIRWSHGSIARRRHRRSDLPGGCPQSPPAEQEPWRRWRRRRQQQPVRSRSPGVHYCSDQAERSGLVTRHVTRLTTVFPAPTFSCSFPAPAKERNSCGPFGGESRYGRVRAVGAGAGAAGAARAADSGRERGRRRGHGAGGSHRDLRRRPGRGCPLSPRVGDPGPDRAQGAGNRPLRPGGDGSGFRQAYASSASPPGSTNTVAWSWSGASSTSPPRPARRSPAATSCGRRS